MLMNRYVQSPGDYTRYAINLASWLATTETISELEVVAPDDITVDNVLVLLPTSKSYQLYVGGGVSGYLYDFVILVTTSQGQVRSDEFQLMVR
jgi:hypothetical protein